MVCLTKEYCAGSCLLCTSISMEEVVQEPVSGTSSQPLMWDSFQPDLFLYWFHQEATTAQVTGGAEEWEWMAKRQAGKEWESASSGGFVLFYAYTAIARANGKGRETETMAGIKSHPPHSKIIYSQYSLKPALPHKGGIRKSLYWAPW